MKDIPEKLKIPAYLITSHSMDPCFFQAWCIISLTIGDQSQKLMRKCGVHFQLDLVKRILHEGVFFLLLKSPIKDHATSHIKYLKPSCTPAQAVLKISIARFQQQIDNAVILHGLIITLTWASCQIRKITCCACAGNAGNVFPATAG